MRVTILLPMLAIVIGLFVAMLVALHNHRARNAVHTQPKAAAVEYVWAIVPWLIVALGAAPAVRRLFWEAVVPS